jgi:hypothetical protein
MHEVFKNVKFSKKSPRGMANEVRAWLIATFQLNEKYVYAWSPKDSEERGYGKCWTVCAEEGPFEWAPLLTGNNESIYANKAFHGECYNGFILGFWPN